MWVQVPPSAFYGAKQNIEGSGFAPFCASESSYYNHGGNNRSVEEIEDWRFEFVEDIEIQEIWNAKIIEQQKEYHYLENQPYNQNIVPGGEVSFGFIARCEDDPELSELCLWKELL